MKGLLRGAVTALGLSGTVIATAVGQIPDQGERVEFRINAPTMVGALLQFSQQSGLQLGLPMTSTASGRPPRVEGSLTPQAALEQLLKDSGLTYDFVNPRTVVVKLKQSSAAPEGVRDAVRESDVAVR